MIEQPQSLLLGDFHVHSSWSDDAHSTIEQNIAAAAEVGLTELRLIDHVRQSTTWVPEFLSEVARQPARDGLSIYTGVEAKILNSSGALDMPTD
ncbi:MAG: PHP domain-containing protein, partial [Pseudolysinimonas sp.]